MSKLTKKGIATKKNIEMTARKLFSIKGFENTTVNDIVKKANVAKGTFYLYFDAKEEVLFNIINEIFFNLTEKINYYTKTTYLNSKKMDFDELINFIKKIMLESSEDIKMVHSPYVINMIESMKLMDKYNEKMFEYIEKYLNIQIKNNLIRDLDTKLYAKIILSICHNLLENALLYNQPTDIDTIADELIIILEKILKK